jgi:hypothetical protein
MPRKKVRPVMVLVRIAYPSVGESIEFTYQTCDRISARAETQQLSPNDHTQLR